MKHENLYVLNLVSVKDMEKPPILKMLLFLKFAIAFSGWKITPFLLSKAGHFRRHDSFIQSSYRH